MRKRGNFELKTPVGAPLRALKQIKYTIKHGCKKPVAEVAVLPEKISNLRTCFFSYANFA